MPTESELQHLFHRLVEVLDREDATTLIDIVSPFARNELATKADVADLRADMAELRGDLRVEMAELRGDLRAEMAELKHDLTRSLGGWLFVSQGVLVAIVGLLVSLR